MSGASAPLSRSRMLTREVSLATIPSSDPSPRWRPDESPIPRGMLFRVSGSDASRRRVRRVAAICASVVAVLLGGALVIGVVAQAANGCGSSDPTDPINATTVTIVNDTSGPVQVGDCAGTWCHQDRETAEPGGQVTAKSACGMSGADMTSYRVSTTAGVTLGYIAVHAPRSDDDFAYDVSRATDRRDAATPHR
jgi:hypothetical protein